MQKTESHELNKQLRQRRRSVQMHKADKEVLEEKLRQTEASEQEAKKKAEQMAAQFVARLQSNQKPESQIVKELRVHCTDSFRVAKQDSAWLLS